MFCIQNLVYSSQQPYKESIILIHFRVLLLLLPHFTDQAWKNNAQRRGSDLPTVTQTGGAWNASLLCLTPKPRFVIGGSVIAGCWFNWLTGYPLKCLNRIIPEETVKVDCPTHPRPTPKALGPCHLCRWNSILLPFCSFCAGNQSSSSIHPSVSGYFLGTCKARCSLLETWNR